MLLQTSRCILCRIEEKDFDGVERLYTNEEVRRYLGGPVDSGIIRAQFQEILASPTTATHLVARTKETNEFIGLLSLDLHHNGTSTEVSYQLLPDWWGKGFAKECVEAVIDFASHHLLLTELVAETQAANLASCRLLEKIGFQVSEHVERFGAKQIIYQLEL